jgi:ABC-type multidrug transport system fused ATPase/permease subunit
MNSLFALYREVVRELPGRAQRFLTFYSFALALLSFLDGAALALLALAISPLATGGAVSLPVVGEIDSGGVIALIAVICGLIITKSVLAVLLLWRTTRTFSRFELELGARLFSAYVRSPWVERLSKNTSDIVRTTDSSVAATLSGFVLPASTLLGEIMTSITLVAVLAVAQPLIAVVTILYLGTLGLVLYFVVTRRVRSAGRVIVRYSLSSTRLITEMIGALKEVTLRNAAESVSEVVRGNRERVTRARANVQFLNQIPRYALDSGIIGGFVVVGGVGYLTGGMVGATTAVALFGLAGFRMAPSLVRFQGIVSQLNVNRAHAERVLNELRTAENAHARATEGRASLPLPEKPTALEFTEVSFRYSDVSPLALDHVDLKIPFGSTVSFVGASGAGKSTVVDLVLGLIDPTSGVIAIDGRSLGDYTTSWRDHVAYVPQDVSIFDSTIAQNVALTWKNDYDPDRVRYALERAQLLEMVDNRFGGIEGRVGERGLALSGGLRQRLGIARALYVEPLVLVMDEATSALDTATEAAVTAAIRSLRGSMTIVTVAHRLSTVVDSDIVFFMSRGKVAASGTFRELVRDVPEFAQQAALAGLAD